MGTVGRMDRDWVEWHRSYDRPESSLTARLAIVTELLVEAFDRAPAGELRCLSLCAGDARDAAGALATHSRAADVVGAVVELDETLAGSARERLVAVAPGLDVRCADAGDPTTFTDVSPVDVLVLVGIFGNVSDDDIGRTIGAVPTLCRTGATVLWTRHRRQPDATPMIRSMFDRAACEPLRFESPGAGMFAIGAERFVGSTEPASLDDRLFSFRSDLW